jgi:hypothetical protein
MGIGSPFGQSPKKDPLEPEKSISGWKPLDSGMKLSPETLFQSVDFIDLNRSSAKPSGRVSGHRG